MCMISKLGQCIVIFDGDVFIFDCQYVVFLEVIQQMVDGFYCQVQIVIDIVMSYCQVEFMRGEVVLGKMMGQVVDECSQMFFGIFF